MEFRLPEIGEGVYEAEFLNWLVKPGDTVKSGQNLMEVMTDKATMELPAPFAGTIDELRATPGQKIKVGDVLLTYTPVGATQPEAEPARTAASRASQPPLLPHQRRRKADPAQRPGDRVPRVVRPERRGPARCDHRRQGRIRFQRHGERPR